ncbi:MAG: YggS family pyridoxal phosphate-dependent enzyme [Anaerolineae bacterium]|nr:YggS family pyridoxal phosphate-dependent enzyme [Anaerolineae bacterium]
MLDIGYNLEQVRNRVAEAALRAGRDPARVRLVAVTKTCGPSAVLEAWDAGQRDFGENRPEVGAEKIPQVEAHLGDSRPVWHMIGAVQRRKTGLVITHFDWVHSLDRLALAERLGREAMAAGRVLPVLLECNVSGEASKAGYTLYDWEHDPVMRENFFGEVRSLLALDGLRVEGLMTMAPLTEMPEATRPVFASLRGLCDVLREHFPQQPWAELSMGMTDDFEVAIEEGATLVRIGRAIFQAERQ